MGFEPTTSAVTGRRSNQLSHRASNCTITQKSQKAKLFHFLFIVHSKLHTEIYIRRITPLPSFMDKPSTY